jgi:hypothetical protein
MPQFKVYVAEVMRTRDVAVIITNAFTNPGGYPRAESFLIIPDDECTLYCKSLSFDVKSFKDSPIELNEEFMLQEALNHARIGLSLYLAKLSEEKNIPLPHAGPKITEDKHNLIVSLWVRNYCIESFKEIARKTEFEPLKEFLKIVFTHPCIKIQEL